MAKLVVGGEVLLFEDFEKMDLKNLPAGWSISKPEDLSILDEPGRGKVLKISHKGNGWPALTYTFDPSRIKGKMVRVSASVKFPGAYTPLPRTAQWNCSRACGAPWRMQGLRRGSLEGTGERRSSREH